MRFLSVAFSDFKNIRTESKCGSDRLRDVQHRLKRGPRLVIRWCSAIRRNASQLLKIHRNNLRLLRVRTMHRL